MTLVWVLALPGLLIFFAVKSYLYPKELRVDVLDIPSEYITIGEVLKYSPFLPIVIGWFFFVFSEGKFHTFVHGH
jgi:hypothetical protein